MCGAVPPLPLYAFMVWRGLVSFSNAVSLYANDETFVISFLFAVKLIVLEVLYLMVTIF